MIISIFVRSCKANGPRQWTSTLQRRPRRFRRRVLSAGGRRLVQNIKFLVGLFYPHVRALLTHAYLRSFTACRRMQDMAEEEAAEEVGGGEGGGGGGEAGRGGGGGGERGLALCRSTSTATRLCFKGSLLAHVGQGHVKEGVGGGGGGGGWVGGGGGVPVKKNPRKRCGQKGV